MSDSQGAARKPIYLDPDLVSKETDLVRPVVIASRKEAIPLLDGDWNDPPED